MHSKPNQHFTTILVVASIVCLFLMGLSQAQNQDRSKVGPEQKKMEVFVGEWRYEGALSTTPLGPAGTYSGTVTNQMILDGLVLEMRGEDKGNFGGKEVVFKEVLLQWYDASKSAYILHLYDNEGIVGERTVTVNGNTWKATGTSTAKSGKAHQLRTSITFSPDNRTATFRGELSADKGQTWMPYWDEVWKKK